MSMTPILLMSLRERERGREGGRERRGAAGKEGERERRIWTFRSGKYEREEINI